MYNQYSSGGHVKVSYRREPNFLERIGSSLIGSVVGVFLVIGACLLLFWNEGRSVYTYDVIMEAQDNCKPVTNIEYTSDFMNNQLVYLSGPLSTQQAVEDHHYGVSLMAVRLKRIVEMYQWIEETRTQEYKEPDGTVRTETHYSYTQAWRNHLVSSTSFDDVRYQNPKQMPVDAADITADRVTVGAYTLGKDVVLKVSNWQRLVLTPSNAHYDHGIQLYNNMLYHSNPSHPQVGDLRVSFEYAGNTENGRQDFVSVVAQQGPGYVLSSFHSRVHPGYEILYVHMGRFSLEELFSKEHSSNNVLTWVLRLVGLLLIFIGFNMITRIIVTLFDWLPIIREMIALSTFLLSFALAFSLTLFVVAVAWIRYRPLYGLAVLVGALLPFLLPKIIPHKTERGD